MPKKKKPIKKSRSAWREFALAVAVMSSVIGAIYGLNRLEDYAMHHKKQKPIPFTKGDIIFFDCKSTHHGVTCILPCPPIKKRKADEPSAEQENIWWAYEHPGVMK